VDDLILYGALGVVLGGRIGYVFFYGFDQFVDDPLWLFRVWDGGMSFHGGLLGVMAAMWLFARKMNNDFVRVMDFIAPMVPVGLGFGRMGNFINQELWGRETDVSWAMVFPNDPLMLLRHPSQLYQLALEGVLLFVILFSFSHKARPRYAVSALFLLCYGVFRFVVEFFREPDAQIGYEWLGWMTRGQELCLPMIAAGGFLLWYAYRSPSAPSTTEAVETMPEPITESRKPARTKPKTEKSAKPKASTGKPKVKTSKTKEVKKGK
jgi:phosphatidylglycerol:prolipoprotein diacylglycerol transferase